MKYSIILVLVGLLALVGCGSDTIRSFDQGAEEMSALLERYSSDFTEGPQDRDAAASLLRELEVFEQKIAGGSKTESLRLLASYRTQLAEAHIQLIDGFQWGEASTTEPGFGCIKGTPRIFNSSKLRNDSANTAAVAIVELVEFTATYGEDAEKVGLSHVDAIQIQTAFESVQQQAQADRRLITKLCLNNETMTRLGISRPNI